MSPQTANDENPTQAVGDANDQQAAEQRPSAPIKIRAYGLLPLTKRAYLKLQVVAFALFLLALIASVLIPAPAALTEYRIFDYLPLIVTGLGLAEGLETLLMLRRFRHKENERDKPEPE